MAFVPENSYIVWQRVKIALANADPTHVRMFKELKATLSQTQGNPDLQFIAFTETQADAGGGTAILTGAATLLAVYIKKTAEAAGVSVDNLFLLYDDATNDTTDANAILALSLKTAAQQASAFYPTGLPLATGLLVTQYTSASGLGKADGSDGGDGFVLLKA